MADYKKTYAEKLRDPRWQKMRLKIMERDEFTCQHCGDKKKTLNVHHIKYMRGADPWEYDLKYLTTLCEICHEKEPKLLNDLTDQLIGMLRELPMTAITINALCLLLYECSDINAEINDLMDIFMSTDPQERKRLAGIYRGARRNG